MFPMAWLYILQSEATDRFHVGSTSNLERRLSEHARGQTRSTRNRGPWRLVYREEFENLTAARGKERQIKTWKSHRSIAELIATQALG